MKGGVRIAVLIGAVLVLIRAVPPLSPDANSGIEAIRRELLLPYYGVFDLLVFSYQKGTMAETHRLLPMCYPATLARKIRRCDERFF